jgi:hypothetical protein
LRGCILSHPDPAAAAGKISMRIKHDSRKHSSRGAGTNWPRCSSSYRAELDHEPGLRGGCERRRAAGPRFVSGGGQTAASRTKVSATVHAGARALGHGGALLPRDGSPVRQDACSVSGRAQSLEDGRSPASLSEVPGPAGPGATGWSRGTGGAGGHRGGAARRGTASERGQAANTPRHSQKHKAAASSSASLQDRLS